jgi:hypothetical protein
VTKGAASPKEGKEEKEGGKQKKGKEEKEGKKRKKEAAHVENKQELQPFFFVCRGKGGRMDGSEESVASLSWRAAPPENRIVVLRSGDSSPAVLAVGSAAVVNGNCGRPAREGAIAPWNAARSLRDLHRASERRGQKRGHVTYAIYRGYGKKED